MKVQINSWCRSKRFLRVAASSNLRLKRENEILKKAAAYFAREAL